MPGGVPHDGDGLVTAVLHSAALQYPGSAAAELYDLLRSAPGPVAEVVRLFIGDPASAGTGTTSAADLAVDRAALAELLGLHLLWSTPDGGLAGSGSPGHPTVLVGDRGPAAAPTRHYALWPVGDTF
nr:hypothetical protein [Micromonospora sp. DSM 115978]